MPGLLLGALLAGLHDGLEVGVVLALLGRGVLDAAEEVDRLAPGGDGMRLIGDVVV